MTDTKNAQPASFDNDPEITAIRVILGQLAGLSRASRYRVLHYLKDRAVTQVEGQLAKCGDDIEF